MKKVAYLKICLIATFFVSCNTANDKKSEPTETVSEEHKNVEELPLENEVEVAAEKEQSLRSAIDTLTLDELIIGCPENYLDELKQDIIYQKEEWKGVSNPLEVVYKGNDIGDYQHILFEDTNGKSYDFGFGANDWGGIELFDSEYNDDPHYLGKSFRVFWEWKIASFPCCSGEYEMVKAYLPSIVKIELISTTENNNMKLGAFSASLSVKDLQVSKAFYENLGFEKLGGDVAMNYLIMKNENSIIGLFQGMFEGNILTFNPGWDENGKDTETFKDIREIQKEMKDKGMDIGTEIKSGTSGPASFMITDPDGNVILMDQHR